LRVFIAELRGWLKTSRNRDTFLLRLDQSLLTVTAALRELLPAPPRRQLTPDYPGKYIDILMAPSSRHRTREIPAFPAARCALPSPPSLSRHRARPKPRQKTFRGIAWPHREESRHAKGLIKVG
jgi:hypothetical protein